MLDLQTLYICKQIPISRHKSENFAESCFQMRAIIQSLQISTQSCPKIRLCGWVKASHWTLVYQCACQFSTIKFQICGNFFNAYSGQFPVYLITKYNYICYFVNFLSMLLILLYLSSQVCLKLVHWINKCMQGQGTFG